MIGNLSLNRLRFMRIRSHKQNTSQLRDKLSSIIYRRREKLASQIFIIHDVQVSESRIMKNMAPILLVVPIAVPHK